MGYGYHINCTKSLERYIIDRYNYSLNSVVSSWYRFLRLSRQLGLLNNCINILSPINETYTLLMCTKNNTPIFIQSYIGQISQITERAFHLGVGLSIRLVTSGRKDSYRA